MEHYPFKFKCLVISPNKILFEKEINSVFLNGDRGEFELLAYHYPLLGVLSKGDVVINNGEERIPINGGIVRFFANECTVMVEEAIERITKKG